MFMPEACLFDLDGLLLDTEPLHGKAWAQASASFGKDLDARQLLLLRGRRRLDCAKQILEWIDADLKAEDLLAVQRPIAQKLLSQAKAMPGAQELVEWCFGINLPMALVTSSASDSFAFKTAPHPWLSKINTKVLGDEKSLLRGKPSPEPFLLAAKKLNVSPKNCWALEDSQAGIKAALDAGCLVWALKKESNIVDNNANIFNSNPRNISSLNVVLEHLKSNSQNIRI